MAGMWAVKWMERFWSLNRSAKGRVDAQRTTQFDPFWGGGGLESGGVRPGQE